MFHTIFQMKKINFSVENVDIGETIFSYYLNVLL